MADDDPAAGVDPTDVGAVADVLYRLAPETFIATRTSFVKAARAAGERDVAKQIQGYGRPTKAAWVLNRLARDAPEVVDQLVALGSALAEAQADLDAGTLRELSDRRRALVRDVSRQAFGIAGEDAPSQALAVEVQDTLTAAVVDPTVGEALRAGALLKAAQASGFGPAGPELAAVPPPRALRSVPPPSEKTATSAEEKASAAEKTGTSARAKASAPEGSGAGKAAAKPSAGDTKAQAAAAKPSAAEKKAQAAAAREAEKARRAAEQQAAEQRARIAAADKALATARAGLEAARDGEKQAQEQLRIRREQVRDADRALGDAGLAVREARAADPHPRGSIAPQANVRFAGFSGGRSHHAPAPLQLDHPDGPTAEVSGGLIVDPRRRPRCPIRPSVEAPCA